MTTAENKRRLLAILKMKKLKLTRQRMDILDLFLSRREPWTLKSLFQKSSKIGVTHESTVYRVLTSFAKAGVLEEFKLPGVKQTSYSLKYHEPGHGHHHHIVCQVCGKVIHIHICLPEPFLNKVEFLTGYSVTEHELEFRGVCRSCN